MGRGETHPLDAENFPDGNQQFGKALLSSRITVRIHVLPEELNFRIAEISELAGFSKNRSGSTAALFSTSKRDDTVRAELVAAFNDSDVAAMRVGTGGVLGFEAVFGVAVIEPGGAVPCLNLNQHCGKIPI